MSAPKPSAADFAVAGGTPLFDRPLPVGQLNFPSAERYEDAMRRIMKRRYFTNHGPLVVELEARLEEYLGVRNVLTVTNATIGLYLAALGLGLTGKVVMPAFTFVATAQAMAWAGLEPVFCEVDPDTHQISPATVEAAIEPEVSAVVAVNLWGGSCDPGRLEAWASDQGLPLLFDSAQGFGVSTGGRRLGGFGAAEVFSFHATKVVSSGEGGCIATNDDELAERIRNMRSNYGIRRPIEVPLTVNGRMSEGQAALALMSLDDFEYNRERNASLRNIYRSGLAAVDGSRIVEPTHVEASNHYSLVCEVDAGEFGMTRDRLMEILHAEGVLARRYFFPGVHRTTPFDSDFPRNVDVLPATDHLCSRVMQLPVGALVGHDDVERICDLIGAVKQFAPVLAVNR